MFGEILQKFAERSPATVMVCALLEQLLNGEKLDQWFEVARQTQYTRDILFSSLVGLMLCQVPDDCIGSKMGSLLRARKVMELLMAMSVTEEAQ